MAYYRDHDKRNAVYNSITAPANTTIPITHTVWLAKIKKPHGSGAVRTWSNLSSDAAHERKTGTATLEHSLLSPTRAIYSGIYSLRTGTSGDMCKNIHSSIFVFT